MITPLSQWHAISPVRGAYTITEPFDPVTLYPPLLAYSIELCRRYGIPEHHAEDFLQEMWLRSFKAVDSKRERNEIYVYLRRRLLGCFQDHGRGRLRHLVGRPSDDAATFDQIEEI